MANANVTIEGILTFTSDGSPIPNENLTYTWQPCDSSGNPLSGTTPTNVPQATATNASGIGTSQAFQATILSYVLLKTVFAGDPAAGAQPGAGSTFIQVTGNTTVKVSAVSG